VALAVARVELVPATAVALGHCSILRADAPATRHDRAVCVCVFSWCFFC
jgi:hypothetical protein